MKQLIRNFKRQKFISLLNICTLSLGIMVAIMVGLWAIQELSFDQFHENKDRIYRIITNFSSKEQMHKMATTDPAFGKNAKEKLAAVKDMCRVKICDHDVNINNVWHPATRVFIVDPNFFSFFTFPLIAGTPEHVLSAPDKVVISESAITKYFPQQDPIGQTVKYQSRDFIVSGIMKDMPDNSTLQTEFVFTFFDDNDINSGWWGQDDRSYNTYLLVQEGKIAAELIEPLEQIFFNAIEDAKDFGVTISLESLNDLYFGTDLMNEFIDKKGNKSFIFIFILTALIILIIACINFANLFVSTSFIRAKTVGIKKCFGAGKNLLIRDFYFETACYVFISIILGLLLAMLVLPVFNNFTQSQLSIDFASPQLYAFLTVLFAGTVLLAGSFPALYMTRFNVIETLTGKFKGKQISLFQKSLVITQFTASIVLLIVVVFMQKQVNYIISYDLGFKPEFVIYVNGQREFANHFEALKGELINEPTITDVTRTLSLPTGLLENCTIDKIPSDLQRQQQTVVDMYVVNSNFFDVLGMEFINDDEESPFYHETWKNGEIVINEKVVELLNLDKPVGQKLNVCDEPLTVKGVVKNIHTKSLHQSIAPQVFICNNYVWGVYFFKISGNPQRAISFIEKKWKEWVPGYPFNYQFLDDTYKQLYLSEMNAGKVFIFTSLITLIITVAGLFAMAYYATQRRVREIALRKVHGATAKNIFVLLNKDFLLLGVIAFVIACPIAYYGLYQWLNGFAVKTPLNAWGFLLVGVITLLVTLLTTGYQTWKAATEKPIKALKTE